MASKSAYGSTPWGAWFIEALENFDENGRLSRGKSYANTGKVAALAFSGGQVKAKVKGHSSPWYKVNIEFAELPAPETDLIQEIIESEPMLLARIESGELPEELLDLLKTRRIRLIPAAWDEMKRSCSCPDWGDPCKHMAAVYYMIAKEIDVDPRLLFRLRGIDLAARFNRPVAAAIPPPFAWPQATNVRKKSGRRQHSAEITMTAMSDHATEPPSLSSLSPIEPPPLTPPSIPELDNYAGFISALLPPKPVFCTEDFAPALIEFYHASTRACAEVTDPAEDRTERRYAAADYRLIVDTGKTGDFPFLRGQPPVIGAHHMDDKEARLSFIDALRLFATFANDAGTATYRFLFHFFRAALAIIHANAFAPVPLLLDGNLAILWRPLRTAKPIDQLQSELAAVGPPPVFENKNAAELELTISPAAKVDLALTATLSEWAISLGFRPRGERSAQTTFIDLFFAGHSMNAAMPGLRSIPQAIATWLATINIDFSKYKYRINIDIADDEQVEGDGVISYAVAASVRKTDGTAASADFVPLKDAAARLGSVDALAPAAALSNYLPELKELARTKRVTVNERRLVGFLGETSVLLSRLGVDVVLPKALRNALKPRLVVLGKTRQAGNLNSYFDLNTLLDFDWRIAIGDTILDAAAFEALLRAKRTIVTFKDGFVALDPAEAARLLAEAKRRTKPTVLEAIQARLAGDAAFSADAEAIASAALAERRVTPPATFLAELRPYQERGFNWILSNLAMGFGCVLADDMGLGKTVQAIAVMAALAADGRLADGALVIAPASLLTNWERELARFAPTLAVERYHGANRSLKDKPASAGSKGISADDTSSVIGLVRLTTFQTAVRDEKKLKERNFSLLVADEAHLLKNADARQSKVVKSLRAQRVLALSGTPVENRLEDLRSLFDFVIPGYLGGPAEFKRRWRVPIEVNRDRETADKLKRITAPFLLRRLKTDRSIIADLPDKIQADEYVSMTAPQAALYAGVVERGMEEAQAAADDPLRKGAVILKLLTALKQICDHPRVYDKESPPDPALSGKTILLMDLLETILERREKVLIFSQYVECLELLTAVITGNLGETPLLYHGGQGQKLRAETVDAFQKDAGKRILLVSLKAGGLGLNLTAASRVIHYDLWFNPATENQATDRAFRIGQTRSVFVHRFITANSFEEKIDNMIKSKRELADLTVGSGETWLSKLGTDDLRSIFATTSIG